MASPTGQHGATNGEEKAASTTRRGSSSQHSDDSQTAADFIRDQMQLEADAREALPYSIENCTRPLGPLRQSVFACLTCKPPPASPSDPYDAAGVCYSCSVQCHGEHTLVEIFNKRNFTCDCGTTRFPAASPCSLRINPETNTKGGVHSEPRDDNNRYNQNFRNRFCGCECDYDPFEQKGTMFQCLGLGTAETGGCGEDWWHPGCVVGMGPKWWESMEKPKKEEKAAKVTADGQAGDKSLPTISEDAEEQPPKPAQTEGAEQAKKTQEEEEDDDPPMPPGFPGEDDFEAFLCYKCVEANPWIKRYAGTSGFLPPVYFKDGGTKEQQPAVEETLSKKRKVDDEDTESQDSKRVKGESQDGAPAPAAAAAAADAPASSTDADAESTADTKPVCKLDSLPAAPIGTVSLFMTPTFRDALCRCPSCFPLLAPHPQLLEEEETYEPPVSEDGGGNGDAASTHGSGSLLERGESALRNVDRVRAIEGVMAYNHLKEQLKPFFQQFAESGRAISAEDVKEYFAKLRGDSEAIREAGEAASKGGDDNRREQSGY
ncbi:uncharacterized protein E0L32_006325 [Thyridium curvatum]|uniref:UBR-type domain-containing protein n=1 Tax=Thyridium curvatum TaxID=1093900 RepID=A0A507ATP1_9PEZI|nr:uncharacterized protein E0L32_006325 [Thyridium curvatum]TPX13352.1 hypothetical protein E0L32_006325 [Thyridium curvatum]